MSSKKDSANNIIKPLAAAFLTTEPDEEPVVAAKPQPRKSAPKPVVRPAEVKIGELTKEETRALLREQLVSAGADEKLLADVDTAEDDEVPFAEEMKPEKKAAPAKAKEPEKKAVSAKEKEPEKKAAPAKEKEPEKKADPVKKESVKKETVKKEPVQKEAVKESPKKESAKKEPAPVKEPETKKAAKADVKAGPVEELNIEYGGCSYSREDLVNRALKIWTSKLKRGRSELHNMELYVKPQENIVYYVFNGKRKGSFEL